MVVVAGLMNWSTHISLGHWLGLPAIFMLITAYFGQLPRSVKRFTWLLFGTFIVQAEIVIFLREAVPILSALHPVLALVYFALGAFLAYQAVGFVQNLVAKEAVNNERQQF